jgi:Anti-sigma-K factor rskA/Putative zinc-finger
MSDETDRDAVPELTCDEVRELAGAFVLDALEPDEAAAVRAHLASCAEPHGEMAELGGVVPALAEMVPVVEPPAELKARIMAAAAAELAAREAPGPAEDPTAAALAAMAATVDLTPSAVEPVAPVVAPPGPPSAPVAFPSAAEREARRATRRGRTSTGGWILRIAAVLAIVALGAWNLLLQNQLNAAKSYEQSVAAVLDVAAQEGSLTAILTPGDGTGSGLAAVSASGEVTLAMQDLAPTTGTTVYETWVIGSDNVPVAIGSFKVDSSGIGTFEAVGPPVPPGTVLALTHEPAPGATVPTGPVVSKGVATAAG